MGSLDRDYQKRMSLAQTRHALISLIAVNLIIFVILAFVNALFTLRYGAGELSIQHFQDSAVNWFSLPADFSKLASRPWTLVTHMFVHVDVWHIIGNMLWLWTFGYILQDLTGNRKIIPVYLYGGLAGGVAFILSYNFFPGLQPYLPNATALGASAGVMAIAAAVTTISPTYRLFPMLFGGIPVWIITGLYLVIDLVSMASNPGGRIAHLAGALIGFLFIVSYRRGVDWGGWMNNFFDWITNLFNPDKPAKKSKDIREELFYKSHTRPYKKTPNITEQRVDEILEKIHQKGYQSLSEEEKELLTRASKEQK